MSSSGSPSRWLLCSVASLLAPTALCQVPATPPAAVGPQLHAAIASSAHRTQAPAIAWLCDEYLPSLPQWPAGLDPNTSFSLSLSAAGLQIRATEVAVPAGAVAIGSCSFSASDQAPLLFRCDENGRERWFVPSDLRLPTRWQQFLHAIEADLVDTSRTLAVAVIIGHLAGALVDEDPRAELLRLGPSLCGDATWLAWHQGDYLHVCGRSDGGLMLPLTLLALAIADGGGELSSLSLRAYAARDADQDEAARQLGRTDRDLDARTLRALLHGNDGVRLTAIEALVRHGASQELPAIVRAASEQTPWATIAARDAVLRLWPVASAEERHATRSALQQSACAVLRELDVATIPTTSPTANRNQPSPNVAGPMLQSDADDSSSAASSRARALLLMLCTSIGLLGMWRRERTLLLASANGIGQSR